ncbi:MAG: threonylcarbamoyl-AMP synthase [Desulfurococcales archaeon ex4484_42]|nr:MAG: threonylcarbamoyl-AMP synthase [Desulfurococcales archaeon ex4484_42]
MRTIRTRVVKVDPINPDVGLLRNIAEVIRSGGLVVFPTETVYGLGANAYDAKAVIKIFKAKERPIDNPLIVHINSINQLVNLTSEQPEEVFIIAKKFWPGPITVVLPKSKKVPKEVTAGLPTIAIRMPAHPVALKLIELSGVPIAAPSANLSGKPSPTTSEHVIRDMYGRVDIIIDAGETLFGIESTIIDLTHRPPVLLRPGAIPVEEIEKVLNIKIKIPAFARGLIEAEKASAPGLKYRHYAPEKALTLIESSNYSNYEEYARKVMNIAQNYIKKGLRIIILASKETSKYYMSKGFKVITLGSRKNIFEVAKNLFKILRIIDEMNIDMAICEGFEEKGLGLTIMNRLRKASGYNIVKV